MEMENRLTGAAEVSAKRTAPSVQREKLRGFGPTWQWQNCGKFGEERVSLRKNSRPQDAKKKRREEGEAGRMPTVP
jgi:hypothetical protein